MPLYGYVCEICGVEVGIKHRVEEIGVDKICPMCDGELRRRWTPPAVVFKGRGFYTTENRKVVTGEDNLPKIGEGSR